MKNFFVVKKLDHTDSPKIRDILCRINYIAKAVGWCCVDDVSRSDVIIAIGGDGTMLYAMQLGHSVNVPVLGFNIGKVGFLSEFSPDAVESSIVDIVNGQYSIDDRVLITETGFNKLAVNEFVIAPEKTKETLKYEFFVNGISSGTHHANGLIISTPTGSTAYSLSVGGSIIQPNAPVFQITPIAPMSLNSRSVIVSNDEKIQVSIKIKRGVCYNLMADGQISANIEGSSIDYATMNFAKHTKPAKLIHGIDWNFFEVLQQKLLWNAQI